MTGTWAPEPDLGTPAVVGAETVSVTIDGRQVDVPAGHVVILEGEPA